MDEPKHIKENKLLILTCPICGQQNDKPLCIPSKVACWAKAVAYMDCLSFCSENVTPKIGDVLNVHVNYPVCCKEGEVFSATIGENGDFMTMRLLNIKKYQVNSAKLHVRILALGNRLSYVNPILPEARKKFIESMTYDYSPPQGDHKAKVYYINEHLHYFCNDMGGDVFYKDYIFTDDDGIDHLVQSCFRGFDKQETYYGDQIIGFHLFSPYFRLPFKLSDGSLSPHIPPGFMANLTRSIVHIGIFHFLHLIIDATKGDVDKISFETRDGLYSDIVFEWMGKISINGFLYSLNLVIKELEEPLEMGKSKLIDDTFNRMAKELIGRSYDAESLLKYLH